MLQNNSAVSEWNVFVGTYTARNSKGIYAYRFAPATGKLTAIGAQGGLAGEVSNPSFLAVHPNQRFLYAVGENDSGTVSAFAVDRATGMLKLLNTVSSKGSGPCHIEFDKTGKWLFVANYNNGSIAVLPVHDDGTLGEATASIQHTGSSVDRQRQAGPHAHSVNISADNRFLIVADLGLDQLLVYQFDATNGSLMPNDREFSKIVAGSGPRHLAFSADGFFAYVSNEMAATISAMEYDVGRGRLTEFQTVSMLPPDFKGAKAAAEIALHPNGKFLYASNRGHDSIVMFNIDVAKGMLNAGTWTPSGGKTPRNFAIDPTGAFLFAANQDSNNVTVFRIDPKTGALTPSGEVLAIGSPVSIVFSPVR